MGIPEILSIFFGFANNAGQQAATDEANARNEERDRQAMAEQTGLRERRTADANEFAALQNQGLNDILATGQAGFEDLLRGYSGVEDMGNQMASTITSGYGNREAMGNQMASGITGGFGDRYRRQMAMLEGLGAQERQDINRDFDNLSAQTHDSGVSRGLSGTSIMPGLQRGVARERRDAQGRLEERLRQQQLATDAAMSGDWLNAQNAQMNQALGLSADTLTAMGGQMNTALAGAGNTLNVQGQSNQFDINQLLRALSTRAAIEGDRVSADTATTNNIINQTLNRNDVAPSQASFLTTQSNLGAGMAPAFSAPDTGSSSWQGPVSAGIGAGGILGGAGILAGGGGGGGAALLGGAAGAKHMVVACVDGNAMLMSEYAPVSLEDVKVGDRVMSDDGSFKEVVWKDYGIPDSSRRDEYVEIQVEGHPSITMTQDHVIGGRAAGSWSRGDDMDVAGKPRKVLWNRRVPEVLCGDIAFKDGSGYMANGLPVASMASVLGMAKV